jgi:ribosomal protein L19
MNITLNNMYKKFLKIGNIIEISYFYNDNLKKKINISTGLIIKLNYIINDISFTLQYTLQNILINQIFFLSSPHIIKINYKKFIKTRRAKLYFSNNKNKMF